MGYTPAFLRSPSGCSFNIFRIGGVKAVETGLIILGTSPDELLDYVETSARVAVAWRDAMADVLDNHRPHRPLQQIDWGRLAAEADPAWAAENGRVGVDVAETGTTQVSAPAAQPRRRSAGDVEA